MASNSSYITCIFERMDKRSSFDVVVPFSMWIKLKRELNHLKIFLLCAESWSSVDEEVRESLAGLMADIEGEFSDASLDLEDAEDGGEEKLIEAAYSKLQEKIEQVKPKMVEKYVYLSEYCFRRAHLSVTDFQLWGKVMVDVHRGLEALPSDIKLAAPLRRQIQAFTANFYTLKCLTSHLNVYMGDGKIFMPFWVYLGGLATCAAQVSYLCWEDGMNANKAQDLIILLSDLQQKIMPCTSDTIEM